MMPTNCHTRDNYVGVVYREQTVSAVDSRRLYDADKLSHT